MSSINDVIRRMPERLHLAMEYVLAVDSLIVLDELESHMRKSMDNIVIADVSSSPFPHLKESFNEFKRTLQQHLDFVYNYQRAVLKGIPTDKFNFDF